MPYLDQTSLGSTLDALSEALFFNTRIPAAERRGAAKWIAGRQGRPGSYAGMFAPADRDAGGFRLFTGERVRSRAGIAHLLGEEACRVLTALPSEDAVVRTALNRAIEAMAAWLEEWERRGNSTDLYCCGTCSAGYWRNLALRLFPRAEQRLDSGLKKLRQERCGHGRWRRFPFFYTSLALTEIGADLAKTEMQYAAISWRKILPRLSASRDPLARRRAVVGDRLLALCEA